MERKCFSGGCLGVGGVWGAEVGPICLDFLAEKWVMTPMKGTLGDASQRALQSKVASPWGRRFVVSVRVGTVTPLQRGRQRWEVMWTAEIITAKHLYCLRGRRGVIGGERRQVHDWNCLGWDSVTPVLL